MITGSCQCEGIQFQVPTVFPSGVNCYCTICRKISGGAYAPVVCVPNGSVQVTAGQDLLHKYNATPHFDRWHCSKCHAPVFASMPERPELPTFIPAGALDPQAIAHVTFDHMFVRSLVPWHAIQADGKQHETYPG